MSEGLTIQHPEAWRVPSGYCEEVTRLLAEQGCVHLGGRFFRLGHRFWMIADNGGEFTVDLLNVWDSPISVGYIEDHRPVDAENLFFRLWDVLRDRDGAEASR